MRKHFILFSALMLMVATGLYAQFAAPTVAELDGNQTASVTTNCTANVTHTANGNKSYTFTATTTNTTNPTLTWDMGDGTTYNNSATVTHTYTGTGGFFITLSVVDNATQCSTVAYDSLYISPPPTCHVAFTGMYDSLPNPTVYLHSTSYSTSGNPLQYAWTFSDGNTSTTNNPIIQTQHDTLVACLTITDVTGGCTATLCDTLYSPFATCRAHFRAADSALSVYFWDESIYKKPSAPGQVQWTFGDGGTSTQRNPMHTYASKGIYNVCLSITDAVCTSTYCDSIPVFDISTAAPAARGQVMMGNVPADFATVFLIKQDTANQTLTLIDSIILTPGYKGRFGFNSLPAGSYTFKAKLNPTSANYASYMPTYDSSSLFWSGAVWLTTGAWGTSTHDISLIPGNNPGGPGFVGGSIFAGANKKGAAMGNVTVLLLDANMNPIAHTVSAADGSFSFSNIPLGSYQLYIEILNRPASALPITLTTAAPSIAGIEVEIGSGTISFNTSIVDAFDASLGAVYPNPTAANAALDLTLTYASELTVEIVSMIGQQMRSQTTKVAAGKQTLTLDTENLPTGVYLVRVKDINGATAVRRLVKE